MTPGLTTRHLTVFACLAALWGHGGVWAGGLQQAWDAALANDTSYRAARAELASAQQNVPMARAGLLPSLSFSMADSKVEGTRTTDNPLGNPNASPLSYRSPSRSLNIRAPLYNREASQKLALAQSQVSYAEAVLATRKLDLMDRLSTAYLQYLHAQRAWQAAHAQVAAAKGQNDLAKRRLQLGEGTRPDVLDTEAALDSAKVLVAEAQNQIDLAALSLRQITGTDLTNAVPVAQDLDTERLNQGNRVDSAGDRLASLLNQAAASHPSIAARRHAVEIAQAAVARNGAGHYPRLDFVASASNSRNESLSTLNQSVDQRSWGLQLNVPLYSGGGVSASVDQALADLDKAQADLATEQAAVALDVSKTFYIVANGAAKISARKKTVAANLLALEGTQKGFATGFNTLADVVQAEAKLAQAQQDLSQTVHEVLLARARLSVRTGAEPEQVAAEIDQLLN
jgi:protease secretion system outer membrane protein